MPFPKEATRKNAPFFTLDGGEKLAELMVLQADLQFSESKSLQARAVQLAFEQYVLIQSNLIPLATRC